MYVFYYCMNSRLLCLLLIKPSPFTPCFCFCGFCQARIIEIISSLPSKVNHNKSIIKLQITELYTDANPNGKWCLNALAHKKTEKHMHSKKVDLVYMYILFILWWVWKLYGPEKYFGRSHI